MSKFIEVGCSECSGTGRIAYTRQELSDMLKSSAKSLDRFTYEEYTKAKRTLLDWREHDKALVCSYCNHDGKIETMVSDCHRER